MANIQPDINKIAEAIYGEEVRGSIVNALTKMNTQAAAAQEWATGEDDPTDTPSATNNAKYFAEQAASSETNAGMSETAAAGSAASAEADALKAEGYAVGKQNGTPAAADEPYFEDNAAYYAGQAAASATSAGNAATDASGSATAAAGSASDAAYWEGLAQGIVEPVVTGAIATWLSDNPTALSDAVVLGKLSSYDTVGAMQSDAYLQTGQVVATLGYTSKGDGGGCLYYISASEVQDAVNIAVGSKYAVMIVPSTVTPEMFGAVGNGTAGTPHDDTAAVQAAVSSGKIVEFQPKTYYLGSGKITIEHDCTIYGNGATLLLGTGSGATGVLYAHQVTAGIPLKIAAYDITLDADSLGYSSPRVNALNVDNCISVWHNVTIKNANYHNIYVQGGTASFYGCTLTGCGDNTGSIAENSFVFADNDAVTYWEDVTMSNPRTRSNGKAFYELDGGQAFYMKNGRHTVVGFRTENIKNPFSPRNGYFSVTKGYFVNSGGISIGTYPYSEEDNPPPRNGADVIVSDCCYDGVASVNTNQTIAMFECCRTCTLENVKMRISETLQNEVTEYNAGINKSVYIGWLMKFKPDQYGKYTETEDPVTHETIVRYDGRGRYIENLVIRNLIIEDPIEYDTSGDTPVAIGPMARNYMQFSGVQHVLLKDDTQHDMKIELHDVMFPALKSGVYPNLGNIYHCDGTARIVVDNVIPEGETSARKQRFFDQTDANNPFVFTAYEHWPILPTSQAKNDLSSLRLNTNKDGGSIFKWATVLSHIEVVDKSAQSGNTVNAFINNDNPGIWKTNANARSWLVPVPTGAKAWQVASLSDGTNYTAFLTAKDAATNNSNPSYCNGYSGRIALGAGVNDFELPSDCTYVYINVQTTSGNDITPLKMQFEIDELSGNLASLQSTPAPSADGTYTLKATVSSGVAIYSWVLDTQQ